MPGLGEVTAARLVAALASPQRRTTMGTVTVTGPADLVPVFRPLLAGLHRERLAVATMHCQAAAQATGLKFLGHLVLGEHDSWEPA